MVEAVEELVGRNFSQSERKLFIRGAGEERSCEFRLEDTMINAYEEIKNTPTRTCKSMTCAQQHLPQRLTSSYDVQSNLVCSHKEES